MISSAVVIPDQPLSSEAIPSPSLKRRQSSFDIEPVKRPRIDTHISNGITLDYGSAPSPPPPVAASSPPRRKTSLISGAEEKKRGQRLFGGLLTTLSQKASSKAGPSVASRNQKREEIEKRQLERIKAQDEEREEEKRRQRQELDESRQKDQKRWDEQSRNLRWNNMRAMAGFLRTKTEPRLYYKPWEVRDDEKNLIDNQRAAVEVDIEKEKAELEGRLPLAEAVTASGEAEEDANVNGETEMDPAHMNKDAGETTSPADAITKEGPNETEPELEKVQDPPSEPMESKAKETEPDHEHPGEELVHGEEDDVIY